jgi:hypothetical protein
VPNANAKIIGLARELSMKTPNWIKTGLMAAFHARDVDPGMSVEERRRRNLPQIDKSLRQFD